jgi:hypothetical protein
MASRKKTVKAKAKPESKAKIKRARAAYTKAKKTDKLGSGKRFSALQKSIEAEGKSPKAAAAIAAAAGRKAHGDKAMKKWADKGMKRSRRK